MQQTMSRLSQAGAALTAAIAVTLLIGAGAAQARGGGFGGGADFRAGGFGGGDRGDFGRESSPAFGDGGAGDRGGDAGFGRDGYGSIRSTPEAGRGSGYTESRPYGQERTDATQQAVNAEKADWDRSSQDWQQHSQTWNNYYAGVAYDRGVAVGTQVDAVPAGAYQLNYLGTNYWYASGAWYEMQANAYVVVPPVVGAVIPEAPPSCSPIETPGGPAFACGGAYYAEAPQGYTVIAPPVGATVAALPSGAVRKSVNGVTYYTYAGAWYRPAYHGGGVSYRIVKAPT